MEKQHLFELGLRVQFAGADASGLGTAPDRYFYYPAALALMFIPLALLPVDWGFAAWSLPLIVLAFALAVSLPLRGHSMGRSLALAMLTYLGVVDTHPEGQVNGLFLLAFNSSLLAFASNRPFLGGALLGVLWLKPQYALLFPLGRAWCCSSALLRCWHPCWHGGGPWDPT
ncbi:MAG: glycosyltransferase family 87 protein [Chloroflexota bacterium]